MKCLYKWLRRKRQPTEKFDYYRVEIDGVTYTYRFRERPKPNPMDSEHVQFLTDIKES